MLNCYIEETRNTFTHTPHPLFPLLEITENFFYLNQNSNMRKQFLYEFAYCISVQLQNTIDSTICPHFSSEHILLKKMQLS